MDFVFYFFLKKGKWKRLELCEKANTISYNGEEASGAG